ncbi:ribokinase [Paenibacillus sambharensis]|uniref:Ribokinase n=1 Tax=Paenibacillus sambharensis TaxID=1803190 RepID=A0A2W1LQV9_9BACL|nr:ribokinase [Paenibacillus sambharensis]PZD97342.1 ribokinase [Paenibacillus sambharensis]
MKKPKIVVIGSINMDIVVETGRYPQVGETLLGERVRFIPGGKGANQAVAAARLGADTSMIGAVGGDTFGRQMLDSLMHNGVNVSGVKQTSEAATGIASIYVAQGDNSIIVVPGANHTLSPEDIERHTHLLAEADIVLLQLEIPIPVVQYAARRAKEYGKTVILNPAPAQPLPDELFACIDYFTPNRTELTSYAGLKAEAGQLMEGMLSMKLKGAGQVITTLSSEGSAFLDPAGKVKLIPAHQVPVVDTTGAGDCYNAALAVAIAKGCRLEEAIRYAALASALAVTKFGAQEGMPTSEEVDSFLQQLG